MGLSLSPRFDQFRFQFPVDFFDQELLKKYEEILYNQNSVITSPLEYINESIQSVSLPGIQSLTKTQPQVGTNSIVRSKNKMNTEPSIEVNYYSPANPLELIDREFKVSMRLNQGLMNYFLMYENIFNIICKPPKKPCQFFEVGILNENGKMISKVKLMQPHIEGLDGLDWGYSKIERQRETFDITFKFNNIDFDFIK